jgi:hypothetical protein
MPNRNATPILRIVEVLGHAEQGKSLPYLCRAEDGKLYYVKGQQTNRASLWAEWICAHLAQALKLPIPPFSLVQVDEALLPELPLDLRAIGSLPAFGSCQHPSAAWLELGAVRQVPAKVQQEVLVFDWWVHNTDRLVGNPNLLWDADQDALVVIDHNLALDPEFDPKTFLEHHVFAQQWSAVLDDLVTREEFAQRLMAALPAAQRACATAPEAWMWENAEFDVPARFNSGSALELLSRCATLELWRTV